MPPLFGSPVKYFFIFSFSMQCYTGYCDDKVIYIAIASALACFSATYLRSS